MMKNKSAIISFYNGEGADNRGRAFSDILKWDYQLLESVHDYIQWLFPLEVSSAYNVNAPILTQEEIDTFRNSPMLQDNLRKAFLLMLDFYGFSFDAGQVVKSARFLERSNNWLNIGNHNMLRITRILTSLSLLGLSDCARQLFSALDTIHKDNPDLFGNSYHYWKNAVG